MKKLASKVGILLCLLAPVCALAQLPDADIILKQATHEKNVNADYPKAIVYALQGLQVSPAYTDIRLLLARLYILTDSVDKARNELLYVLKTFPENQDALAQLSSLETSQHNFDLALDYNKQALTLEPGSHKLQLTRIALLRESGRIKEAYAMVKPLAKQFPEDEKFAGAAKELFYLTRQNRVAVNYSNTRFERTGKDPWTLVSTYYSREEKFATLIGRVNYADRSYDNGIQFELEAYPKHKKGSYSFVNLAYSGSAVFPDFRFAYSYLASLPKAWEAELGFRYQYNDAGIMSYTGSLGKYLGNYWFNFRTFLTPNEERISQSYTLTGRFYQDSADDYFTLVLGTGISPDDRSRNFQLSQKLNLRSVRLSLGYQRIIWGRNILGLLGTLNNEEHTAGNKENEFDMTLNFQHKF